MEINLNKDLFHALKFLVAAIDNDQQYGLALALDEARTVIANTEMVLDFQEVLEEG